MSRMLPSQEDQRFGSNGREALDAVLQQRRRRYRVLMVGVAGASYAIDVFFLCLFYWVGKIPESVPIAFALAALAHIAIFSLVHWSGLSERAHNPYLIEWQMAFAIAIQLGAMYEAPQIKGYFLALIFIIFAFGALRLSIRGALGMWLGCCLATAYTLQQLPPVSLAPATSSVAEGVVVALSFAAALLRCLLLNYYGTLLRTQMFRNAAALNEKFQAAQEMATRDCLTGALNRHAILPLLGDQIELARRKQIPAAVALIDIDHFKSINDHYGHLVGDAVLNQLVRTIAGCLRPTDKVARYGGEEFVLLMPCTALADGLEIVERVRVAVAATHWGAIAPGLNTTFSAGVTDVVPEDAVDDLLSRADAGLYEAKHSGRNRSVALAAAACLLNQPEPVAIAG